MTCDKQTILCRGYVKAIVLLLALLYSFYEYSWGEWFPDGYYWIHISKLWKENPMTLLSLWSMNEWHGLCGRTLIANRILGYGLNTMIVLLAFVLLVGKRDRQKYWYFLCGAFVVMGPGICKTCTPDSLSSLIVVLIMGCVWRCRQSWNRIAFISTLSILTALLVAVRFPNIVGVFFVICYLYLTEPYKKYALKPLVFYLVLSLTLYWGIMAIGMETTDVIRKIQEALTHASGTSNGRHSIIGLLLRYGKSILLSLIACTVLMGGCFLIKKLRRKHMLFRFVLPIFFSTILLYEIFSRIGMGWHSWSVCFAGIVIVLLFYCVYKTKEQKNYGSVYWILFVIAMMLVPSAGSDTGFQKSTMLACGLIPLTVYLLERINVKREYVFAVFMIVMLTSVQIFNERAFYHCHTTNIGPMQHILWEKWEIEKYEKLYNSIKPYYRDKRTIFYGLEAHFLYCLTDTRIPYSTFWMEQNDTTEINRIVNAMYDFHHEVLIDLTKSDPNLFTKHGILLQATGQNLNVYYMKK